MYILFDIGGTKTRVALSHDLSSFSDVIKYDTPPLFEDGMVAFQNAVTELIEKNGEGSTVTAGAGGIRGPLSPDHSTILSETILTDWVGKPIAQRLSEALGGVPVEVANDTALAGLGEANSGAGKGYPIVAYHTVSTGVGGVRIVDGKIDVAHGGFEPGHQIIDADGTLLKNAPDADTLEELISGGALEKRFGVKPYLIPQSDPVWQELALWLAYGVKNTILYWSPDVIVLGGSMIIGNPRILLEDITKDISIVLGGLLDPPPIVDAKLGDEGGLYGAMVLLKK